MSSRRESRRSSGATRAARGSRRVAAELRAEGQRVGRHRVRRLMREQGLRAMQPRRFVPRTTDSRHGQRMSPNLLRERGLRADRPLKVLVGDITYLPLRGGQWAYLATWLDLYSRKVVGWQVAESMTAAIVTPSAAPSHRPRAPGPRAGGALGPRRAAMLPRSFASCSGGRALSKA